MFCFRLIPIRHCLRHSHFTIFYPMEAIEEKAKLTDQRIQQLKSLIATVGQLDPEVYAKVLQEENTRLKTRVQSLVNELTTLENERGVTQEYDFVNKIPKAPTQSNQSAGVSAPTTEAAASSDQQESKDKKDKKKKTAKEEKPSKPAANTAVDITRFDLRIGKVLSVENHPDADTLYVEQVDIGEEKPRTVCSGVALQMPKSELDQRMVVVLCNLKPAKMRGIMSEAMVICAFKPEKDEFLEPPSGSKPGDRVVFDGYDCTLPHAEIKKDLTTQIFLDACINDKSEATYKGVFWKVANVEGIIKCKSYVNVPIK